MNAVEQTKDSLPKVFFAAGFTGVAYLRKLFPLKFLKRLQNSCELERPMIDEVTGTVCWRDGMDFSPSCAYELVQEFLAGQPSC